MNFTLTMTAPDGTALYTSQSEKLAGIKGGATRKLNSATRDWIPARIQIIDEDNVVHYDEANDAYVERVQEDQEEFDGSGIDEDTQAANDASGELDDPGPSDPAPTGDPAPSGKRLWKVIRSAGPNRSFGSEEAAREFASDLPDRYVEVRYGDTRAPRECRCGCGGETKGGTFLPGHDRRFYVEAGKALEGDERALAKIERAGIPSLFGEVEGTLDPEVRCDAACEMAVSDKCRCSCGGENHRAGWAELAKLVG